MPIYVYICTFIPVGSLSDFTSINFLLQTTPSLAQSTPHITLDSITTIHSLGTSRCRGALLEHSIGFLTWDSTERWFAIGRCGEWGWGRYGLCCLLVLHLVDVSLEIYIADIESDCIWVGANDFDQNDWFLWGCSFIIHSSSITARECCDGILRCVCGGLRTI